MKRYKDAIRYRLFPRTSIHDPIITTDINESEKNTISEQFEELFRTKEAVKDTEVKTQLKP